MWLLYRLFSRLNEANSAHHILDCGAYDAGTGAANAQAGNDYRRSRTVRRLKPVVSRVHVGLVYVLQTIDLKPELGGEEQLMTLDGEPAPPLRTKNVTVGLVIDNEGHIVTRLAAPPHSQGQSQGRVMPLRMRFWSALSERAAPTRRSLSEWTRLRASACYRRKRGRLRHCSRRSSNRHRLSRWRRVIRKRFRSGAFILVRARAGHLQ